MKEFDNIKDLVYCEIDEISRLNKLDMNTVKVLGELVDILKDIGSVEMFEEGIEVQDDEYSFGYSMSNGMMNNGGYSQRRVPIYYNRGNSYRSRGYNDMGGSYSRRGRNGYSREDGKQHMVHKLEELMNEAQNDEDREAINRLIDQMENN